MIVPHKSEGTFYHHVLKVNRRLHCRYFACEAMPDTKVLLVRQVTRCPAPIKPEVTPALATARSPKCTLPAKCTSTLRARSKHRSIGALMIGNFFQPNHAGLRYSESPGKLNPIGMDTGALRFRRMVNPAPLAFELRVQSDFGIEKLGDRAAFLGRVRGAGESFLRAPGIFARNSSRLRLMAKPSPSLSSVIVQVVSRLSAFRPSFCSIRERAIVKQPAWAAASNSSGLVPVPCSKRSRKE